MDWTEHLRHWIKQRREFGFQIWKECWTGLSLPPWGKLQRFTFVNTSQFSSSCSFSYRGTWGETALWLNKSKCRSKWFRTHSWAMNLVSSEFHEKIFRVVMLQSKQFYHRLNGKLFKRGQSSIFLGILDKQYSCNIFQNLASCSVISHIGYCFHALKKT